MTNPFFDTWDTPFGVPPFEAIRDEHFAPAYKQALAEHDREIAAIAESGEAPNFDNTIAALELAGKNLRRLDMVFSQLAGANTNTTLQGVERDLAPVVARHWNDIFLNAKLFARIDQLYRQRDSLGLDAEAKRVLERYHLDFVRSGAQLTDAQRARFAQIVERLAVLATDFAQNVLGDEQDVVFALTEAEVEGLPEDARASAAELARDRKLNAPFAASTSRSSVEPILHYANDRGVREKVWRGFVNRGRNGNKYDNRKIIAEIVALRSEIAALLGYDTYAAYKLDDTMAKTPEAAQELLEQIWVPGRDRAIEDAKALQALIDESGETFALEPWDWRYYAEKLRHERFEFDESAIKPYLQLDKVIDAAFYTASRLFSVSFAPRDDIAGYHPDVRVWTVERGGKTIALFYGDFFARPGKRSGAWMTSFRDQQKLGGEVLPIIVNTCNFNKPPEGEPSLLSLEEARTVFHEFGHALHGMLSNVTYPRISGTSTVRDYVELPSQLYEHWLEQPQVLERFTHCKTGAPIPAELLARMKAARNANTGFETVEVTSSALLDMAYHTRKAGEPADADTIERETLAQIGMPSQMVLRHASPHFLHIFSGDGYSAGYYSYLWSEVLDADGFEAFDEAGDPFDPATAKRLYDYIYSGGGSRDFAEAYRLFRGRDPDPRAMLKQRGLLALEPVQDTTAV
jgi:peptidyl-dipeptidase Dcp